LVGVSTKPLVVFSDRLVRVQRSALSEQLRHVVVIEASARLRADIPEPILELGEGIPAALGVRAVRGEHEQFRAGLLHHPADRLAWEWRERGGGGAPWYNYFISDSDLIPREMSYFKQQGIFKGHKIGVTAEKVDQDEMNLVLSELKKLKVPVVQMAVNTAPATDTVALTTENGIIAQRFKASGVSEVIPVGNAGNDWPRSEQNDQTSYLPRLVVADYLDLDAYVTNAAGHSNAILKGAITAGGIPPVKVTWDDPTMKRCIAKIQANEPNAPINDPVTATSSTPVTWTAPELACSQMALFQDIVKAAGRR
jgi:hypothetical protein